MNYGKEIKAQYEINMLGVSIYMFEQLPTGRFVYEPAGELKKKPLRQGTAPKWTPTLFLEDDLALQLYIELDKIFGKERAVGNSATLEATKYHLEDMRKIAFQPPYTVQDYTSPPNNPPINV